MGRPELANRTHLEVVERDNEHIIYYMFMKINPNDLYVKARTINRFLTTESKIMERVLETDIKNFLREYGIIPQRMTESVLNETFNALKQKNKQIVIIDRNKNAYEEQVLGVSKNGMTVISEDDGSIISIAMEVRVIDYE